MQQRLEVIQGVLRAALRKCWDEGGDPSLCVLAAEALGCLNELPLAEARLEGLMHPDAIQARDALFLPFITPGGEDEGLSLSARCSQHILQGTSAPEEGISRLRVLLHEKTLGSLPELIQHVPVFTWLKVPLPDTFPSLQALIDAEIPHDAVYLNALYHLSLLEADRPVEFQGFIDDLEQLEREELNVRVLYDACLRHNLLAEVFRVPVPDASVRRLPAMGHRDVLSFLDTQGIATTQPFVREENQAPVNAPLIFRGPEITVLVPVFNSIATLNETLGSLQRQHYPNWQAIIVDGPSHDGTRHLVEQWARYDSRVTFRIQRSKGLAAARNEALEHAAGEWIHCLDGDDLLEPDFYARMAGVLAQQIEDTPGHCAVSSVRKFSGAHEVFLFWEAPPEEAYSFPALAKGGNIPVHAVVFERKLLQYSGAFDSELRSCEDWDLWMRFARVGAQFSRVPEARAWYRILETSLSRDYLPYIKMFKRVALRAAAPDDRCKVVGGKEPAITLDKVNKGLVLFWLQNIRRSACQRDPVAIRALMNWGSEELPTDFWRDPTHYHANYKFRRVDTEAEDGEGWDELEARLIYLKAFTLWWPGTCMKELVRTQIESLLFVCKSRPGNDVVRRQVLEDLGKQPLRKYAGLRLTLHLYKLTMQS